MPKFDKPDSPNIIWGVNALDADLTRPDDSYIQTGWTQVKPPYEYENYSMNKLYQGFAYYNQLGFPEWDSVTEYQAGKSYVQGSNNRVYKCIQTHTNRNPATAGNESWWELFEGNRQATTASRGTVELATPVEVSQGISEILSVTPRALFEGVLGIADFTGGQMVGEIPLKKSDGSKIYLKFIVSFSAFSSPQETTDSVDSVDHFHRSVDISVTFPEPFNNFCVGVFPVGEDLTSRDASEHSIGVRNKSKTGVTFSATRTNGTNSDGTESGIVRYLAIGF